MNWAKAIKDAAKEVMENLGSYYNEGVYEEAVMHEFRLRKIPYERQRNIEILYKGYSIGMRRPDCVLNPLWAGGKEEFVLEIKAVAKIADNHIMQAQVYLNSMSIKQDKPCIADRGCYRESQRSSKRMGRIFSLWKLW